MILLSAALPAQAQPSIVIQKFTNGNDADLPPGPILPIGSAVLWTYAVTNYGDVNLTSVAVVDDQGVVVSCPKTTLILSGHPTPAAAGSIARIAV